ncbi:hypothetical protein HZZ00_16350 [Streptomyces sp. NEAU-sy36]|uniref:hypothetical protein n=1 Tax=unclassified Streptomyces TaxID=2593676 RepID=UPI0015D63274|nr:MULTISPECIES: hypothetical protein [unclassified Streptomyces]QLJ02443.1 hypothetical protein HZZ00_16350 [Streptomyces sp. NEAU-sy36]
MPGQRKRKRRQQAAGARSGAGHWQVVFETQDRAEWQAYLSRLRARPEPADWSTTRVDTLCGRLAHPTTYRLSLFVPARPSR